MREAAAFLLAMAAWVGTAAAQDRVAAPSARESGSAPSARESGAAAQDRVGVRIGEHPGHGRLVFDWAEAPAYRVGQEGGRVVLRFPRPEAVELPRRLPRNMLGIEREGADIVLRIAAGARIRHFRNGPKVAIDVFDPPTDAVSRPVPARQPSTGTLPRNPGPQASPQEAATLPQPTGSPAPMARDTADRPAPTQAPPERGTGAIILPAGTPSGGAVPEPARVLRPEAEAGPSERARPDRPVVERAVAERPAEVQPWRILPAGTGPDGSGLRITRAGSAGIAMFRRGARMLVVLDEERATDVTRMANHPAWPGFEARAVPGGVVLAWTAGPGPALLRRDGPDWLIAMRTEGDAAPFRIAPDAGRAALAAPAASRVITLADPETELPLLVGTLREAGLRQPQDRAMAEFDLLETQAGLAVLARADHVTLRAAPGHFLLGIEGGELAWAAEPAPAPMTGLTRSFDLPALPVAQLLERLRAAQLQVAGAAPLTRAAPRRAAAEALLALGMPQEAAAMLGLAEGEAPQAAQDPRHRALSAAAALLAGRGGEMAGPLGAQLQPSDELTFWRAVQAAQEGDRHAAAAGFAATAGLLPGYPEPLRRRLMPLVAETLAAAGHLPAARRLLGQAGEEPALQLAQAMLDEAAGDAPRALEGYEAVANGRDRRQRARALRRATELRLAAGQIEPAAAATALERTLYAWRGDGEEVSGRARIAALRLQAGDPRGAMAMLREAEAAHPEAAAQLRPALQEAFLAALRTAPPLEGVALHDAQPDLLPADAAGEEALAALAGRLGALDLADRASALLQRAMTRLPAGEARAGIGARLADLRLTERDPDGALAALGASGGAALPTSLLQERALLAARAEARRGRRDVAAEALRQLGPAGDEVLAEILAESRDFGGAAAALGRHFAATAPARGPLPEASQRVALRLAALLAMAGDERALAALRQAKGTRMDHPALSGAFAALTTDPVRGLADLPRLARELNLFRSLGQMREPLRTAGLPAG